VDAAQTVVSLPFTIMSFVLINGWNLPSAAWALHQSIGRNARFMGI
jgi:flagellar biosynthesis protein FliP